MGDNGDGDRDPDSKHIAYVKQILGILKHQMVGSAGDATGTLTIGRQLRPVVAIVYAHFTDLRLARVVQSLFQDDYVNIGAKAPIADIELINTLPRTNIVMRPFTVQKMAGVIAAMTGKPVPVARPL